MAAFHAHARQPASRLMVPFLALAAMFSTAYSAAWDVAFRMLQRDVSGARREVRALLTNTSGSVISGLAMSMVGAIMLVFVFVIVLNFYPILTAAVKRAQDDGNTSSQDRTTLGLLPTLLLIAMVLVGIAFMVAGIREVIKSAEGIGNH